MSGFLYRRSSSESGSSSAEPELAPENEADFQHLLNPATHVELSARSVMFPPHEGKVFFDQTNRQLIIVNNQEITRRPYDRRKTRHVSLSPIPIILHEGKGKRLGGSDVRRSTEAIYMEKSLFTDYRDIYSVLFSPDQRWAVLQFSSEQLCFAHLRSQQVLFRMPKRKGTSILGFFFTYEGTFVMATSTGLEMYSFEQGKEMKLLKEYHNLQVQWYKYSHRDRLLLLACGSQASQIYSYHFEAKHTISRLPKFGIDVPSSQPRLEPRQVVVCNVYRKLFCAYIPVRHRQVSFYQFHRDSVAIAFSITLHFDGDVAISVLDNVVVVHSLDSKLVLLYDIEEEDFSFPVVAPLPLASFHSNRKGESLELYADHWEFLAPRYILDRRVGYFWELQLNLLSLSVSFTDKLQLFKFLVRRTNSKAVLLRSLCELVQDGGHLSVLAPIFDLLTEILADQSNARAEPITPFLKPRPRSTPQSPVSSRASSVAANQLDRSGGVVAASRVNAKGGSSIVTRSTHSSPEPSKRAISPEHFGMGHADSVSDFSYMGLREERSNANLLVITQCDTYQHVFLPLEQSEASLSYKYIVAVILEYIRSLSFHRIVPQHWIHELLIDYLVRNGRFYQLHQLLQYHVVTDSVPVACQLLSLERDYPPAFQLALDMLKRLFSPAQIVEVLLTRGDLTAALRVAQHHDLKLDTGSRRRVLTTALENTDRPSCFYSVYMFFYERGELDPQDPAMMAFTSPFRKQFLQRQQSAPGAAGE